MSDVLSITGVNRCAAGSLWDWKPATRPRGLQDGLLHSGVKVGRKGANAAGCRRGGNVIRAVRHMRQQRLQCIPQPSADVRILGRELHLHAKPSSDDAADGADFQQP